MWTRSTPRILCKKPSQGMVQSLDPHSQFMPPEAFEELQVDTKGEFGGIGIVVTLKKSLLTVIAPIEGTPAYKAGIKAGDIIIKVDGASTKEMMLWEAVKKCGAPRANPWRWTIVREGREKPIEFKLVRDIIPIDSVKAITVKPAMATCGSPISRKTPPPICKPLWSNWRGVTYRSSGLVLDLRDNPGGPAQSGHPGLGSLYRQGNYRFDQRPFKQKHERVQCETRQGFPCLSHRGARQRRHGQCIGNCGRRPAGSPPSAAAGHHLLCKGSVQDRLNLCGTVTD